MDSIEFLEFLPRSKEVVLERHPLTKELVESIINQNIYKILEKTSYINDYQ